MDSEFSGQSYNQENFQSQDDRDTNVSFSGQFVSQSKLGKNANKQLEHQAKLNSLLAKRRQPQTNVSQTINLPSHVDPTVPHMLSAQQFFQDHGTTDHDKSSVSSKLALTKAKFRKLNEQRDEQYNTLIQNFTVGQSSLDTLFEQINVYEKQQEKFQKEAYHKRQQEINEETSDILDVLEKEIVSLQNKIKSLQSSLIQEVKHVSVSTSKLFSWQFTTTNSNFQDQTQKQQHVADRIKDIDQALDLSCQNFEMLLTELNEVPSQKDLQSFDAKITKIYGQILDYIQSEVKTLLEHIEYSNRQFKQIPSLVEHYVTQQMPQYFQKYDNIIEQQQSYITSLQLEISNLKTQVSSLEQKTQFSWFASNLLIQQDHYIKEGIQESTSKQANMLDLMSITNNILKTNIQNPQVQQHIENQFKDSVMSLKLQDKKPYDFPQVGKIQEFMNAPPVDERQQADSLANQADRQSYEQKVNEFFKQYPKETFFFMQNANETSQPQVKQETDQNQQNISTPVEQQQQQQQNITNQYSAQPQQDTFSGFQNVFRAPKPEYGNVNILGSTPAQKTSNPNINIFEAPAQQQKLNQPLDLSKMLNRPGLSNGAQQYGANYTNSNLDVAKLYASFNFREKYNRNIHPQIFILQFETAANQCQLNSQQKAHQFMFCLQHEFLDWYKVRVLESNYNLTWPELKESFVSTFSHDDDEIRDDLNLMYQDFGETPYAYLQRLRSKTTLSNLTDIDIKKQFTMGLKSQDAKNYLNYMKQFAKQEFKNHTSTTLLQQLEKQARLQRFSLVVNKTNVATPWKKLIEKRNQNTDNKFQSNRQRNNFPSRPNQSKTTNFAVDNQTVTLPPIDSNPNESQSTPVQNTMVAQDAQNLQDLSTLSNEQCLALFDNPSIQEQLLTLYHDLQDYNIADDDTKSSNMLIGGPHIPTSAVEYAFNTQSTNPQPAVQVGEGEQVHSLFRKGQKNTGAYTDKLIELTTKGKELQKVDLSQIRKYQYIHLPEQQLLIEAPSQFMQAIKYLQECLNNNANLLKSDLTIKAFNKFSETLAVRMAELQNDDTPTQTNNAQVNILENVDKNTDDVFYTINAEPVDFLLYLDIQFQNTPIKALLDTGSTVTVVSRNFLNKSKLSVPQCKLSQQVTIADGTIVYMKQWDNTYIQLDNFNSIKTKVLISENASYDMLFGLDLYKSINAILYSDKIRYSFKDKNNVERFGSIPLVIKNAK